MTVLRTVGVALLIIHLVSTALYLNPNIFIFPSASYPLCVCSPSGLAMIYTVVTVTVHGRACQRRGYKKNVLNSMLHFTGVLVGLLCRSMFGQFVSQTFVVE